jgi:hypothetical protein
VLRPEPEEEKAMFENQAPLHRQIEDVDPGWLKAEVTSMARSALIAIGLALAVGFSVSEYLGRAKGDGEMRIVVAPEQAARVAGGTTSCADATSRCASPASSR